MIKYNHQKASTVLIWLYTYTSKTNKWLIIIKTQVGICVKLNFILIIIYRAELKQIEKFNKARFFE